MCRRSKRFSIAGQRQIGVHVETNIPRAVGNHPIPRCELRGILISANGAARSHSANMHGGAPTRLRVLRMLFADAREKFLPAATVLNGSPRDTWVFIQPTSASECCAYAIPNRTARSLRMSRGHAGRDCQLGKSSSEARPSLFAKYYTQIAPAVPLPSKFAANQWNNGAAASARTRAEFGSILRRVTPKPRGPAALDMRSSQATVPRTVASGAAVLTPPAGASHGVTLEACHLGRSVACRALPKEKHFVRKSAWQRLGDIRQLSR